MICPDTNASSKELKLLSHSQLISISEITTLTSVTNSKKLVIDSEHFFTPSVFQAVLNLSETPCANLNVSHLFLQPARNMEDKSSRLEVS